LLRPALMPCVGKSGRPSCATFFYAIRPFFPRGRVVSQGS
jgi:hypothetical protein